MHFQHIHVQPLSGCLGAEIERVDLAKPLEPSLFDEIHRAFLDYAVVVFRGQTLTRDDQIAFGRRFGELDIHPIAEALPDRQHEVAAAGDALHQVVAHDLGRGRRAG